MYEWEVYLVNSIAGSVYADKLLQAKTRGRSARLAWAFLYLLLQALTGKWLDGISPFGVVVKTAADIAAVLLLTAALYRKDPPKQLFAAVSFAGGKKLILYIIEVAFRGVHSAYCKILGVLVEKETLDSVGEVELGLRVSFYLAGTAVILLYLLLLGAYLTAMAGRFVKKDDRLRKTEYVFLILPSAATLCIAITLQMMILSVERGVTDIVFDRVPATLFWVPFICILLLGVNLSSVILFRRLAQLHEEERKRSALESQMAQMQREIAEIQDIYADMRGLRHDMRSHLESIAALAYRSGEREREELTGYIDKMEETIGRLDFAYQTGNAITDVILHQKKQEAERRDIVFTADFTYPAKKQIDVYDIAIVLHNALENAVEAAGKAEGERRIGVRSYQRGSLFFIEVVNDFSGDLTMDRESGLPVSGKGDGRLHGLGMENIRRCAGKYKGDLDIAVEETDGKKKFILTVMMYEKEFAPETA